MNPTTPPLPELIQGLAGHGDPLRGAYGHNYLFEERVSEARQEDYEAALALPNAELRSWKNRHLNYLHRKVFVGRGGLPETFASLNADALIDGLDTEQLVVRVERFDGVLAGLDIDLATVSEQLAAQRRGGTATENQEARAFLGEICSHWNGAMRGQDRPAFAAFLDDVENEIGAPDWTHQLRNRLGLSHYHVPNLGRPIAVALVQYRVKDVLKAAGAEPEGAFAVPTVLDGELNTHYFPAPRGVGYGRTLDLEPDPDCQRLVAEILHRRIDYTPDHLIKFGWMTTPIPPYAAGSAFARLRNGHLFCLRYESGRDDFGANLPEVGHG